MPPVRRKRCTGCGRLPKKGGSGNILPSWNDPQFPIKHTILESPRYVDEMPKVMKSKTPFPGFKKKGGSTNPKPTFKDLMTDPKYTPTDSGFKKIRGKWYKNSVAGLQEIKYIPTIQQQMRGYGVRKQKKRST